MKKAAVCACFGPLAVRNSRFSARLTRKVVPGASRKRSVVISCPEGNKKKDVRL